MSILVKATNIVSPLGFSTEENFSKILAGNSGVKLRDRKDLSPQPLHLALIDENSLNSAFASVVGEDKGYTRFEKIGLLSLSYLLHDKDIDLASADTLFILSTTKGNIELLEPAATAGQAKGDQAAACAKIEDIVQKGGIDNRDNHAATDKGPVVTTCADKTISQHPERLHLWHTAQLFANHFGFTTKPLVISNACISGLAAMVLATRMIKAGLYRRAVILGADAISRFIVSGFQSFMSLSASGCMPFDARRDGLNLGEGAASILLEAGDAMEGDIELVRGAMHNDANHISGPSRTGEGLFLAIRDALEGARPDLISAHGTATPYNDNMESIAVSRSGLNDVPVNSLKGYFGHTLGAAGLLEAIISIESMKAGVGIGTRGFEEYGVSEQINVIRDNFKHEINSVLKLASGFGGSNAAVLIRKNV